MAFLFFIEQRLSTGQVVRMRPMEEAEARAEFNELVSYYRAGIRNGCVAADFPAMRLRKLDLSKAEVVEEVNVGQANPETVPLASNRTEQSLNKTHQAQALR